MSVMMTQTLPEGVAVEMLDAVSKEMDVENDPPTGMIIHVHYADAGRTHVVDVWDSQEDYTRFRDNRLRPAMMKVAEQHGVQLQPPPEPLFVPLQAVVRGR